VSRFSWSSFHYQSPFYLQRTLATPSWPADHSLVAIGFVETCLGQHKIHFFPSYFLCLDDFIGEAIKLGINVQASPARFLQMQVIIFLSASIAVARQAVAG
jgi:hypothetical protein